MVVLILMHDIFHTASSVCFLTNSYAEEKWQKMDCTPVGVRTLAKHGVTKLTVDEITLGELRRSQDEYERQMRAFSADAFDAEAYDCDM